jgi:preprotein translocase subunit SecB
MADTEPPAPAVLAETAKIIAAQEPGPNAPMIRTVGQYLKDLSFENPRPFARRKESAEPTFDIVIGVHSRKADDGDYMLEFSIRAESRADDVTTFLAELIYVGCYSFANIPEDQIEPILHLQLAPLLFPYARQILDNAVQNGGYPPLHLEVNAVDYITLFKAHLERKKRDAAQVR